MPLRLVSPSMPRGSIDGPAPLSCCTSIDQFIECAAEGLHNFGKVWNQRGASMPRQSTHESLMVRVVAHSLGSVASYVLGSSSRALGWSLCSRTPTFLTRIILKSFYTPLHLFLWIFDSYNLVKYAKACQYPLELISEYHGCFWIFLFLKFINELQ